MIPGYTVLTGWMASEWRPDRYNNKIGRMPTLGLHSSVGGARHSNLEITGPSPALVKTKQNQLNRHDNSLFKSKMDSVQSVNK